MPIFPALLRPPGARLVLIVALAVLVHLAVRMIRFVTTLLPQPAHSCQVVQR